MNNLSLKSTNQTIMQTINVQTYKKKKKNVRLDQVRCAGDHLYS